MKGFRNVVGWAAVTLLVAGIGALSVLGCSQKGMENCDGIEISFDGNLNFLSAEEIKRYITDEYGAITGLRRDSVKLAGIEELLESESSVKECEAWIARDGKLNVEIISRIPCVMFDNGGLKFYVDKDCYIFPTGGKTVSVPVIAGDLPLSEGAGYSGHAAEEEEERWIRGIIGLLDYVGSTHRWKGKVLEFSADRKYNVMLKTELGQENINIGYPDEFERKFRKIEDYYNIIVPEKGVDYYKNVDVKYNKQIICRRDI